jgi:hypothetical protein
MVSSKQEFVLLLNRWKDANSEVGLTFKIDACSENPLSAALVFGLRGTIATINDADSFFALAVGEQGLISIGFENAWFNFATSFEVPNASSHTITGSPNEVDELITIVALGQHVITLFTLRP